MSYYGGLGPMTNAVLWVVVVVFALFVALRLYTRKCILNAIGLDDYLVIAALVRPLALITLFKIWKLTNNPGRSSIYSTLSLLL
jgi:hypothetical protein